MAENYTVVRSGRKTLSLQITRDLEVVVRAPRRLAKREIATFVKNNAAWIEANLEKMRLRAESEPTLGSAEIEMLKERARAYIPGRVEYYAWKMGLSPTGIKVTSARSRFGSCSAQNSLCFSYILMRYPPEAIDYVVVHELAHIVHKNHSKAFYAFIEIFLPDYKRLRALLRG